MNPEPTTIALATIISIIVVAGHYWVLITPNRNAPSCSRRRTINLIFAIWHAVGTLAIVVVLLFKTADRFDWAAIPCALNQFASIYWWLRAHRAIEEDNAEPNDE